MSDDIDQESTALLNRADTLLARRRTAVNATPMIPVLTEAVGATAASAATAAIPTLTDIVASRPSAPPANGASTPQPSGSNLEQTVYRKLRSQFDQELVGMSQHPPAPELAAAFDQALRKLSGELKTDIDAMVRAAVEEALRARTGEPRDAQLTANATPDSPPSE